MYQFSEIRGNFDFLDPNSQKCFLVSKFSKSKSGFGITILEILCAPILTTLNFWAKFAKKWFLWSEFQISKSGLKINTPNILCVPIFSQNGQFFGLNLGKLPNYVQYFRSYIVEGVAESWVEAEMSWVEVGGAGWRWMELGGSGCTV